MQADCCIDDQRRTAPLIGGAALIHRTACCRYGDVVPYVVPYVVHLAHHAVRRVLRYWLLGVVPAAHRALRRLSDATAPISRHMPCNGPWRVAKAGGVRTGVARCRRASLQLCTASVTTAQFKHEA